MIKKLKYKARRIEFEPPRENTGVKVFVFLMAALSLIFHIFLCDCFLAPKSYDSAYYQ